MQTPPLLDRRITKSIAVRTDAVNLASMNLRFSVDVRAPIIFKPRRLVISTLEGQEARKRVLLQRADGETLEILSADTGDPTLLVVANPVVKKEKTNDYEAVPGELVLAGFAAKFEMYRYMGFYVGKWALNGKLKLVKTLLRVCLKACLI